MKYLNRHPLSEMAYNTEATNPEIKEFVDNSLAFHDILALAEDEIPYKIEADGTILFLSRTKDKKNPIFSKIFGLTNFVSKNADGTWTFETRRWGKKPEGEEGYKMITKSETYNTLENCLRHYWSYLVASKIDPAFDRAAKRREFNDPNEQKYWGQKLRLADILLKEETLLDKKIFMNLIEDINDKFNQFGIIFQYSEVGLGGCVISSDLSAIRGSLLALLVNNKPKMAVLNKNIKIYITSKGENISQYDYSIMPRTKKEAYNSILRSIITTYSDTTITDRDSNLTYIKNLISIFVRLNFENPNLPKPHTLFDLYKQFYNEMDLVPLLILAKLELRGIIPAKVSQGYRADIDDFISKAGSNKYTFNLPELYEDMKMYILNDSGVNNIEEFRAYIIGVIHNLGLTTNAVKDNVLISIP